MRVMRFFLGLMFLITASGAYATQHNEYNGEQIRAIVEHDLAKHEIGGVSVTVEHGVVTLRGVVRSAWEKSKAVEAALDVHDVTDVIDELTVRGAESDESLVEDVGRAIERYVFYGVFDAVGASVLDSKVTLQGWVSWSFKASEIANHVSRITGVKEVSNEIEVLPVSHFDDELRVRLAVAIYRDLPGLANRAHPPIHIVVNSGRVILAGAVRNRVEKVRSEHIARSAFGVLSVDNQLRVDRSS